MYGKITRILSFLSLTVLLGACSSITRIEKEVYTITDKDTTYNYHVTNHPGNRDNGAIFPSSKVIYKERDLIQRDSVTERYYPDFIRLGFLETIGTIGGDSEHAIGTGLFGIFPDFADLSDTYRGNNDKFFSGGIYKIGITEHRLRWFRDSKNWTIGTHIAEFILPDARGENALISILPLYIRKRYYISEQIPYLCFTPSIGFGLYPSFYTNISGSLDLGSMGGLNLRIYAGLAAGHNPSYSPQIRRNDFMSSDEGKSVVFPYVGIGASFLDFHNLVKETETEWQYHEHSGWDIGLIQFAMLSSNADKSIFSDNRLFTGFQLKIANSFLALPYADYKVFLGTSLFNIMVLGENAFAMAVLPIRAGYWAVLIDDELSAEPFIEYGYYPSKILNLGCKINLVISESINLGLVAGYVNGSNDNNLPAELTNNYGITTSFSNFYLGLNFGIIDRIFFPHQLRYNK